MTERNVLGERISQRAWREMVRAARRRTEIIAARLTRRDLIKQGLITAGGYLVAKRGLSVREHSWFPTLQAASLPVQPFVDPLPIMPVKSPVPALKIGRA